MFVFQFSVICAFVLTAVLCDSIDESKNATDTKNDINDEPTDFSSTTLANLPDFKKVRQSCL